MLSGMCPTSSAAIKFESVPYVAFVLVLFCSKSHSIQAAGGGDGYSGVGGGLGGGITGGGLGGGGPGGGGGAYTSTVGFLSQSNVVAHIAMMNMKIA